MTMCTLFFSWCLFIGAFGASESRMIAGTRSSRLVRCRGVKYPGLGCFTLDPPFNNSQWLPQHPSDVDTTFLLYTRSNPTVPDIIDAKNRSSIKRSHYDANLPVKILIHGFLQYGAMDYLLNMTRALLNYSPMNVIIVDWSSGAGFPYSRAVANTRIVGAETTRFLKTLRQVLGMTTQQVHLIGHSLGAHAAGYVGASLQGVSRITGLDPAQPSYSGYDKAVRLDGSDARFVDIIHTDASPFNTVRGYGMMEPVGHVDFYPNGGYDQPGCYKDNSMLDFVGDVLSNGITRAEVHLSCSHERSAELFIASILSTSNSSHQCSFMAFPCQSAESFWGGECVGCGNWPCLVMGFEADTIFRPSGVFFLNTTGTAPFCAHHYVITLTLSSNMNSIDGCLSVRLRGAHGGIGWTEIMEGQLSAGEVLRKLVVNDLDIGEINQVDVKLTSQADQWVELSLVDVNFLMRYPKKYFTQSNMTVAPNTVLILTSGTLGNPHI
ncbi:unnamed protein product [Lymnaea stagnalis]|uniref:Lipase domain-containing protein n=1 Tax=Lymnaea stagnalis TaxID=6523 RepID=A0AAV2IGM9_LYMST